MNVGVKRSFFFLAVFQALHSLEEYNFELWKHLAPARFLSGLVSDNLQFGFAVINCGIVILIFSSYLFAAQRCCADASGILWFWAVLEALNGTGHMWFGVSSGGYFPGLYTAPFLLFFASMLIWQLTNRKAA